MRAAFYKCADAKQKKTCDKKSVRKQWLEALEDQRQALVDTFINAIYLYDDKVLITFNYKEGTQTVTFGEATEAASEGNGLDSDCFTASEKAVKSKDFTAFLFCRP